MLMTGLALSRLDLTLPIPLTVRTTGQEPAGRVGTESVTLTSEDELAVTARIDAGRPPMVAE